MYDRQLYPDFLRATSIAKIVAFHYFSWQLLTYIPSLGIMFALGGWFVATSLNKKSEVTVLYHRLIRLLPTWWAFAGVALLGGFFYAKGAGVELHPTLAWVFPFQQVTWNLDNPYANDATVVTWYIATYIWLLLWSPLLMQFYKRLSWIVIFAPVLAMVIYSHYFPTQETIIGEAWYDVLTFGGCWVLGFAKADGSLNKIPRYVVWIVAGICSAIGIGMTIGTPALSDNPVALSIMSFGIAMLLLSFNPDLSALPQYVKDVIRSINTYAVTIYLFHNMLIDCSYEVGNYVGAYDHGALIGQWSCFAILIGLIYATVKTIGIVETHEWIKR